MRKSYYIVLMIGLFVACNVFEPRSAAPPESLAEWHVFATTHEKCLENLEFAYKHRQNVYQYGSIFSDDFIFYFDSQDITDFSAPRFWRKAEEIDMLINAYLHTVNIQEIELELDKIENKNDSFHGNYAWIFRSYELHVNHSPPNIGHSFSGSLQLLLEMEGGIWKIKEWHDLRNQQNIPTWGRMKNAFAS